MLKLMKYEMRKTMFSKFILLIITAVAEIAFLIGVFFENDDPLVVGITGLIMCAMFGILYIGIESLIVFQRDLNTKQSYMLFLTPTNSYQVLGAKIVENGCSILITGAFFIALAALDATIAILYIGGLKEFMNIVQDMLRSIQIDIVIDPQSIIMVIVVTLLSWLATVVTGYLAIVLSATVFAGKRYSGFVSFLFFMLISWVCVEAMDWCTPADAAEMIKFLAAIGVCCVEILIMYYVTGWIMERRLSV